MSDRALKSHILREANEKQITSHMNKVETHPSCRMHVTAKEKWQRARIRSWLMFWEILFLLRGLFTHVSRICQYMMWLEFSEPYRNTQKSAWLCHLAFTHFIQQVWCHMQALLKSFGLSSAHACSSASMTVCQSGAAYSSWIRVQIAVAELKRTTSMSFTIEERGRPNTQEYRVFFSKSSFINNLC